MALVLPATAEMRGAVPQVLRRPAVLLSARPAPLAPFALQVELTQLRGCIQVLQALCPTV